MTEHNFISKAEATRFYVIETLQALEEGQFLSKKELKKLVDGKLIEIDLGSTTDANFSQALKILTGLEQTPITKNPFARGLYGYDKDIEIDLSNLKSRKQYTYSDANKSARLDVKIINILNNAKKEITTLIDGEQVPLTVLLDNNSEILDKYKEKIRLAKESSEGIDLIIDSLINNK